MTKKIEFIEICDLKSDQITIAKNNNLIIDDVESLDTYSWQAIGAQLMPSLLVMSATDLSIRLREKIVENNVQPEIVVYPGQGSLEVKKRIGPLFADITNYDIGASRRGPQDYPSVSIPNELEKRLQNRLAKSETLNLLILDDVVGSGKTLDAITLYMNDVVTAANQEEITDFEYYSRFRDNYISYGLPTYVAATWLMYMSALKYKSYGETRMKKPPIAAIIYKGENGRAPVNSMSTLLRSGDKEDKVRAAYATKYSNNPVNFLGVLKEIGGY